MRPLLDLLITADRVQTMTGSEVEGPAAVGISAGKVAFVASADHVPDITARETVRLPPGAAVVPGLTDAHSHPIMGLTLTEGVDLSSARTPADVRGLLAAETARGGRRGWILGWGLDPNALDPGTSLARDIIDDVTRGCPAFVRLFDAHSALANEEALAGARVTRSSHQSLGTGIVRDEAGEPTGLLNEFAAMNAVAAAIPEEPAGDRVTRLMALLSEMARSGLTGAHVMDALHDPERLLVSVEEHGDLPLRLRFSPWLGPEDDVTHVSGRLGARGRRWRMEGVKLFIDGTIDNGTAWLDYPDVNGQSNAPVWPDLDAFGTRLLQLDAAGIPTATHAIGDAGIAHVLRLLRRRPLRAAHRIEHLEMMTDDTVRLLRGVPHLAACMQPTHCTHYTNAHRSDNWSMRLGDDRARLGWRTRDVISAGVALALGSDWPIAPFAPLPIMADSQLRRRAGSRDSEPIGPGQRLTAREALAGYTTHASASIGGRSGRIRVGAPADLTMLSLDPLSVDAEELAGGQVLGTTVDGVFTHRSQ